MTIHRINEYNRLNIPMVMCGGTKNNNDKADRFEYTKDEWEAMDYIDRQLPLPEDLEKRLMDTLPERLARNKKYFPETNGEYLDDEGVKRVFGIDLRKMLHMDD
jgi:hypothetical protein